MAEIEEAIGPIEDLFEKLDPLQFTLAEIAILTDLAERDAWLSYAIAALEGSLKETH